MQLLIKLADKCGLPGRIEAMFTGEEINVSEDRAVLHVALRAPRDATIKVDGQNVVTGVHEVLDEMADFATDVRSGAWLGHSGKRIRDVINIGIGGSDLGPRMAHQALRAFGDPALRVKFVSNIDGAEFVEATYGLDPAETLFIISSKSWHTLETLTNAATAHRWVLAAFDGDTKAVARHFVAVSTNADGVAEFGIDTQNMFGFWDWVGGPLLRGFCGRALFDDRDRSAEFLRHAGRIPRRRRTLLHDPASEQHSRADGVAVRLVHQLPGRQTQAVLPYTHDLAHLPAYLQQLEMESNGKHVTLSGDRVDYQTGQIIWGQPGTNGQHAFYQLIHQGTKLIPCDFIGIVAPLSGLEHQHDLLMANVFAQTEGLAFGRSEQELGDAGSPDQQIPYRVCEGNQPTTTLLLDRLDPRMLGRLIAAYEHKVFTEGVIWDIDSFDQWGGVELSKILATTISGELTDDQAPSLQHDGSTSALIRRYRKLRGRSI